MDTAGHDFKVLVADDSAVYRKLVEQTLDPSQYSILFAKTGQSALELFELHHPALVITDWVMPDFTGIELCRQIRATPRASYTYIIIVTSVSEKENVVKGLAAGADDYLTKPFHPDELSARVAVGRRIVNLQREIEAKNQLLQELALTDALTGLPNRRAIDNWAERQLSGAARHGFSFWVVMADLDNFKSVNDAYGHDGGDAVLKEFGEILKANSRRSDICGRVGGEEFLMILTHADERNVRIVVERVRNQLRERKILSGQKTIAATASFGVSGFQGKVPPEFAKLVSKADEALYLAKRAGRNRIEVCAMTPS
ncbi:MAG TPA: diguanylate cyclase [Candidatus Limnocylindrales bacterium]|nr:diguanylate cyclase [Candidatus Limnocylindrales bacterium]